MSLSNVDVIIVGAGPARGRRVYPIETWSDPDPVSEAQKAIVNPTKRIYSGLDTNALIPVTDRYYSCHFGKSGQKKFASAWFEIFAGE